MKLWVDPSTGKKWADKLEDFDYDKQKDFETVNRYEEEPDVLLNTGRKRNASREYIQINSPQMIEMRKSGKAIRFIAQYFGISDTAVRKIVNEVFPSKRMTREKIESYDEKLIAAYKRGLTMHEVAKELKISYHTVNNRLHELEKLGLVEVRTTHESRKMKMGAMA